jgi:hypothetical protein
MCSPCQGLGGGWKAGLLLVVSGRVPNPIRANHGHLGPAFPRTTSWPLLGAALGGPQSLPTLQPGRTAVIRRPNSYFLSLLRARHTWDQLCISDSRTILEDSRVGRSRPETGPGSLSPCSRHLLSLRLSCFISKDIRLEACIVQLSPRCGRASVQAASGHRGAWGLRCAFSPSLHGQWAAGGGGGGGPR